MVTVMTLRNFRGGSARRSGMNRRRASAFIASLLAVGLLAGCGGGSTAAVEKLTPVAAVQRAADKASGESAKYTLELTGTGINVRGAGAYRGGADPAASMTFSDIAAMGMKLGKGFEYRLVDDAIYVKLTGDWLKIPADAKGAKPKFGSMDPGALTDPVGQLRKMLDTKDVTEVGAETIDGVRTTHYRAKTETDGIFGEDKKAETRSGDEMGAELEKALRERLGSFFGGGTAQADVWIDSDYRARRFVLGIPMFGGMKLTMNISDYGMPVSVEAPAGAKAFDGKNLSLDALLGEDFDAADLFGGDLSKLLGEDFGKNLLGEDLGKLFDDVSTGGGSQKA